MAGTFFITTAIDYTNAPPHIGHAYEKILADVIARYHRLKGDEVFFLTGVDQHGQKVQQSADKAGIPPQQFVDEVTKKFTALWKKLEVDYTKWAATTDPLHKDCVRKILTRLNAEGQIYKAARSGYYSVRQEQFLTDKERGPDGEFGPEWGQVEFREEENYHFKLAGHKQWLLDLIDARSAAGKPLVVPDFRVSELRNAVEKLEGDLCISRPKARLAWGIEFPFDPEFVTYVWFDALVNYLSFSGYDAESNAETQRRGEEGAASNLCVSASLRFKNLWPALHVIGKDILIPAHGIYWPIMLKALGFANADMPTLLVHGWWNIAGAKMSKSTGNIVDPDALADKYGPEALRYHLMSDIATGRDTDFSEERLIQRYNTDLANSLGNLLNRSLNMAAKYREGKLRSKTLGDPFAAATNDPDPSKAAAAKVTMLVGIGTPQDHSENLKSLRGKILTYVETYQRTMNSFELHQALFFVCAFATDCNKAVDDEKPWALAKDPAKADHLDAVLYALAESLRIIAILIWPVLPDAAHGIFDQLAWKLDEAGKESRFRLADAVWGGLPDGHQLGKPVPLFPRIETAKE